jgi:transposase
MFPSAREVRLRPADRALLETRVRAPTTEQRHVLRARIVLLAAEGWASRAIARVLGIMPRTASLWRIRYAEHGLEGLADKPRPGGRASSAKYDAGSDRRILALLDQPPPAGQARWTGKLLAAALGDISDQYVWRFLRAQKIDLDGRRSWCVSHDPEFVAKSAEIIGLYLDPPEGALVLSVDEKPRIQALERAQGYLKLANGRTLTGHSHRYRRHGTTTLFAALNVATGEVKAAHYKRRRRVEFLDFMNRVIADHPDRQIHVVLDNLNTHKPKRDLWLARHPNVHFHFTPTHASWMNQVEIWFSILSRSALQGASFTSPKQIRTRIDAFLASYNAPARPFSWKAAVVHQKHLRTRVSHP